MKTYLRLLILMNILVGGLSYGMEATEQDHGVQSSEKHHSGIVIPRGQLSDFYLVYPFESSVLGNRPGYGWLSIPEHGDRVYAWIVKLASGTKLEFIDKEGSLLPRGLFYWEKQQGVKNRPIGKRFVLVNSA